ncbi:MAG TPA: heparinase II/III family protein [Roseiarcus sp.]|nr:heparinase II/III family protein [Roseiarcus sp.]
MKREANLGSQAAAAIKMRLVGLTAAAWLARLTRPASTLTLRLASLGARRNERLIIAPRDIRTADPIAAEDIYAGYFALAGRAVNVHGASPFETPAPSRAWAEALHGFGWLRHLRAADTALSRANARALVEDWLNVDARSGAFDRSIAHDPRVASRRLLSWLSHSPMILENADRVFYRRFARAIAAHAPPLERALAGRLKGGPRLEAAIALTQIALSLENASPLLRRATRSLSNELDRQVLPDGGHIGRNPQTLVDLLLDLLPTRQAFAARSIAPPDQLLNAIDRMTPMLRLFRHGDGALANFNGMGVGEPETLATLLAYGDAGAAAAMDAPYSGYQRLDAGGSVAIVDVGRPPPWEFSTECHAGCLSFEFSAGLQRIIVNCGAPSGDLPEARLAARATAAHSTLTVDDHSSCRFAAPRGLEAVASGAVLQGPAEVRASRGEDQSALRLDASHDGYARAYGLLHERALLLAPDGAVLWGEDRLVPAGKKKPAPGTPVALRFHLHPDVKPALDDDARGASLVLPTGEIWRLEAEGREIAIEESIFFSAPGRPRRTAQLTIRGVLADSARLPWSLARYAPATA